MALGRLQYQAGTTTIPADARLDSASAVVGSGSRQLRWWKELTLLCAGYGLYTIIRDLAPARRAAAFGHAATIYATEKRFHLAVEWQVNHWLASHAGWAVMAGYYYASLHFAAVIAVLGWLFVRHPAQYERARTVLVTATLSGLAVFWLYPVAPPRLTAGFVDTVVTVHTWGSWGSSGVAALANPYAAMPSLHTAWATWAAGAIAVAARRPVIRVAVFAYPLLTVLVIVATANHYVFDAAAGLLVLLAATIATGPAGRNLRRRLPAWGAWLRYWQPRSRFAFAAWRYGSGPRPSVLVPAPRDEQAPHAEVTPLNPGTARPPAGGSPR
jgi:PAP2 superfamily